MMRFVRTLAAAVALACSALVAQGQAAVPIISYSGTLDMDVDGIAYEAFAPPAGLFGKIKTVLTFSQPMQEIDLYVYHFRNWDVYLPDGTPYYGNDTNEPSIASGFPYPARRAVDISTFTPPKRSPDPDGYRIYSDTYDWVEFNVFAPFEPRSGFTPGPVAWTLDIYAMGVPEPATWTLLIFGFGATGIALRRRQRAGVASEKWRAA